MKNNVLISVEKNYFLIGSFKVNDNIIIPDAVLNIEYGKNRDKMNRIDLIDGIIDDNSDAFFLYNNEWFIISSEDYKTLTGCESSTVIEMIKFLKSQNLKMA